MNRGPKPPSTITKDSPQPWSTDHTPDQVYRMLAELPYRKVVKALGTDKYTLWQWIRRDPERYATYKEIRNIIALEALDEADELSQRVLDGEVLPKQAEARLKHLQYVTNKAEEFSDKKVSQQNITVTHKYDKMDEEEIRNRLATLMAVSQGVRQPLTIEHE